MQSSAEQILKNMELLYENIYNLLLAFQRATNSNFADITVPLKNQNGIIENVKVNSFQKLQNELTRIDNNFKSLTNSDNISYIVNGDGSLSQFTKTSFMNADYLSNFKFGVNPADNDSDALCFVDSASILKNMVFPNVKIPVYLDTKIKSSIRCKYFEITDGFNNLPDIISILDIKYLLKQGTIAVVEDEIVLDIEKEKVKFFGKFTVIDAKTTTDNKSTIILDNIKYTSLSTIGNSIDLKVNDILVTNSGTSKYIIDEIDIFTKILKVTRIAGSDIIKVGIDSLLFNETLPAETNMVGIPISPNKKYVIFLSTENNKNISYPSAGIKLDTSTYQVTYEDTVYSLDEFFSKFVTNFSEYIFALVKETTIPLSLGIKPIKPVLDPINFTVTQINKHLTNAKSASEIQALNEQKQKIKNDIEYKTTDINTIQNEVDTIKFKSSTEKQYRIDKIQQLKSDINVLNQNLLTITRNLDSNAFQAGLKDVKPKYRTIGFWPIQPPIFSPLTKPQNIIKYEVQYRYLSKNVDTVDSTSIKMINNGKEINVVFSSWNELQTRTLNKIAGIDGTLSWEVPILDSVSDININQLNVSIQEGESVEVKIRAISEAGYPISPMVSEWSDTLRIDFPNSLTDSSINSLVSQNDLDLRISEFNNILQTSGILNHISGQIQENERTFFHKASEIASGFYTPEQKIIDVQSLLTTMQNNIKLLQNKDLIAGVAIEMVDFKGEKYSIVNNTTMELSAGNYSDTINLLDNTKFGTIIRKQGFIKIKNNNQTPIEVRTLIPGVVFNADVAPSYYNVGVKTPTAYIQASKQIVYFRNIDLTGQSEDVFKLVKPKLPNTTTKPNPLYIDPNAIEDAKNIVYLDTDDNNVKIASLKPNAGNDFVAFTKEHPLYVADNKDLMKPEFDRIKLYTKNMKAIQYQTEKNDTDNMELGFLDNDFYTIGENTTGAFLYPIINNPSSISVVGNNTTSTLIIQKESELLIPFVFEFRMMDRLGKVNGVLNSTINDDLTYSKKLGIDLLINNDVFKFDINVSAKLKSNVAPIESLNVSSIVGQFGNENPEIII